MYLAEIRMECVRNIAKQNRLIFSFSVYIFLYTLHIFTNTSFWLSLIALFFLNILTPADGYKMCVQSSSYILFIRFQEVTYKWAQQLSRYSDCYGPDDRGSIPGKRFFSIPQRLDPLWGPSSLLNERIWDSFLRRKATRAWSWPLNSIWCRGQQWRSYTSTSPYIFMSQCLITKHRGDFFSCTEVGGRADAALLLRRAHMF
jgi:hypothetical protein